MRSACYIDGRWGTMHWTAGQRRDPNSRSTFVWRVGSTVSVMTYTNWMAGEPNYGFGREACMIMTSGYSYQWNDDLCSFTRCSVCELDI